MGKIPMPKTHIIKCWVTKSQHEKIASEAHANGYVFIAHYLRDLALNKNKLLEEKILDTNEKVRKLLEVLV